MAPQKNSRIARKFNGIPFIPTVTSTADMKTNFGFSTSKQNMTPGKRLPALKFGLHDESVISKKLVAGKLVFKITLVFVCAIAFCIQA